MRPPQFYLTADALLVFENEVLLVQRKYDPFKGRWALPGGFVDADEKIPVAAQRELEEETGVKNVPLKQFGTYGDPGRDPRGRVVSVVFWARLQERPQTVAGDDAVDCRWFDLEHFPSLAFDHAQVLEDARRRLNEIKGER